MDKKKAIEILQGQLQKLKETNSIDVWKNQTASFAKDIFGEESHEYEWITKFNVGWYYSREARPQAVREAKARASEFLENCIETIRLKGVYKKPKQNFLQTMGNATLVPVILFAVGAVFSGGMLYGKYLAEVNNNDLRQEVRELVEQKAAADQRVFELEAKIEEMEAPKDTVK